MTWIAGVDGCRGGWIAAIAENGGESQLLVAPTLATLLAGREPPLLLAIDMPIGLPDRIGASRGPEPLVRAKLGRLRNAVFNMPSRQAVEAVIQPWSGMAELLQAHRQTNLVARATSSTGAGCSIQAFCLFDKVREIDALLRDDFALSECIRETHPELVFRTLKGTPLDTPKKVAGRINQAGMAERRALLIGAGLDPALVAQAPPRGAAADDALDALACLVCAREIAAGRGRPFPDPPGRDSHGLPVAIWGFHPATAKDDR